MLVVAHGIRTLGVLGAGQMGTGIALVSALRAKVPVVIHDKSPEQVEKSLSLVDKLLTKDVSKGRLTAEDAKTVKDRISVAESLRGLRDVDMVVEVRLHITIDPCDSSMYLRQCRSLCLLNRRSLSRLLPN